MPSTQKKMMQWLDDTGKTLNMPGSLVVSESTGEDFQTHSADKTKHLTAAEKALLSNVKEIRIVNTIAERDALADAFVGMSAYVKNATGDSTVSAGGAYYIYDGTAWVKTAESESMDVVLQWANIQGKPYTDVELADMATKKHAHTNAASLDKLSVDAVKGFCVDGEAAGSIAIVANAAATPVYNGKLRIVVSDYTPPVV
ncbi:MAG: hypothetical protein RR014_00385 [Bilophila sp.]